MKYLFAICLTLLTVYGVAAQSKTEPGWKTIVSKGGDFSISLPGDFLIYGDRNKTSLYGGSEGMSYSVSMESTSNAKKKLTPREYSVDMDANDSHFVSGDFKIVQYTFVKQNEGIAMDLASSKGAYAISLKAENVNDPTIILIFDSIRLNGVLLSKRSGESRPAASTASVESLKTSADITAALKHRQSGKVEVEYNGKKPEKPERPIYYSNPVIILQMTRPKYNNSARDAGVSGSVQLYVLFKANGDIGKITVLNASPGGLAESSVEAAKKLKFYPAHVNGKPVDSSKMLEYSFSIG